MQCIENLNFPLWVLAFIKSIIKKWELEIQSGREVMLNKRIEQGILQGDILSLLLFVLCIDPLSIQLNMEYLKVQIKLE